MVVTPDVHRRGNSGMAAMARVPGSHAGGRLRQSAGCVNTAER
jgi:hypothetical protein